MMNPVDEPASRGLSLVVGGFDDEANLLRNLIKKFEFFQSELHFSGSYLIYQSEPSIWISTLILTLSEPSL